MSENGRQDGLNVIGSYASPAERAAQGGSGGASVAPLEGDGGWMRSNGESGLIVRGAHLTPGESAVYRKLLQVEALLKQLLVVGTAP